MNATADALRNWLPSQLNTSSGTAVCRWLYTGGNRFTEPFFVETISRCLQLPENSSRYRAVSGLDVIKDWSGALEPRPPAAFIFHVSRCGSTLLSQLLALSAQHTVLSEVPVFDELLRLPYGRTPVSQEEAGELFRSALQFYSQSDKDDQRVFVKTDSWHIFFYPLLRSLYPHTPFLLLYRDPAAVLRSQQKKRGMHAVPGVIEPQVFGWDAADVQGLSLDDHLAKVIERYLQAFLDIAEKDRNVLLVNYSEGMQIIARKLYHFTGIYLSEDEEKQMVERSRFHAKYPGEVFGEATTLPDLGAAWTNTQKLYQQLENLRTSTSQPVENVPA
jgi:hypothetical protein